MLNLEGGLTVWLFEMLAFFGSHNGHREPGSDHGVGHPLLILCPAKAPNYRNNKMLKESDHCSKWPKVADAVIEAGNPLTKTSHRASQGVFSHRCLRKASAANTVITGLEGSAGIAEGHGSPLALHRVPWTVTPGPITLSE